MTVTSNLRQWVYDLRKKYISKPPRSERYTPGLPEGIEAETLGSICLERFDERVSSFSHLHLSGWKRAGAYRLSIKTQRGKQISLIFKNANYSSDHIPALEDLPLLPGSPEYAIYSQTQGDLRSYLPEVYLAEEVQPGLHYRYLLENLDEKCRRIISKDDALQISCRLPELHEALRTWLTHSKKHGLLKYDQDISFLLQEYARTNLEAYSQKYNDASVKTTLSLWPQIANIHLNPDFITDQSQYLIHGDTNYTNFHLDRRNPTQFKLVDWEWAGFGSPFADLASLLKGTPEDVTNQAFMKFIQQQNNTGIGLDPEQFVIRQRQIFLWCQLERGLLDAGFLAAQQIKASYQAEISLPDAVSQSLKRALNAYQQLSESKGG